jgi:hypothetical protein
MAVTRLSDVIEPSVFAPYVQLLTTELSALWQSGIILPDAQIQALAQGDGKTFNLPFFNDLSNTESNVGTDNPASTSTPEKITAGQDVAVKHYRNQSWSSADLVSAIIGPDPMEQIASRVAAYWVRDLQNTLINSVTGLIADNVANDSGDMVHDIATDASAPVGAGEKISAAAVIAAQQTAGDHQTVFTAIAMHSVLFSELKVQNLITFIPNARGEVNIPTYLGLRVIVDDGMPAVAGSQRITYDTYLFGQGAVAWGEGSPRVPVETSRDPDQGDGEGVETLYSRRHFILHPRGIEFTSASVASTSPTNAELATATNWNRVYDRKLVRLAVLQTNG